jgi:formate-dependent nitrite reductase membrane component NrfD
MHEDDRKDVPFTAPWVDNVRHRAEPNRVRQPGPAAVGASVPIRRGGSSLQPRDSEASYYDVPMLKQPLWKWEIASYFFLGGLSAGAYAISRLAARFGGDSHRNLTRVGSYLALASLLPCPPLLIHDLGDPKRFHHMLRVWKPSTPMNLGTWSIVGYSAACASAVLREYLKDPGTGEIEPTSRILRMANQGLLVVEDAAGIPLAILVAGYTGVLLSCTANPLWCRNPWLGPLFSASAISTGAEALSLALAFSSGEREEDAASQSVLRKIDSLAHGAELLCMRGFQDSAGEGAMPLRSGSQKRNHRLALGGIIAAEVLKALPLLDNLRRPLRLTAAAMGLAAGFALRWSIVMGGHPAASDPHLARITSRARTSRRLPPRANHPVPTAGGSGVFS